MSDLTEFDSATPLNIMALLLVTALSATAPLSALATGVEWWLSSPLEHVTWDQQPPLHAPAAISLAMQAGESEGYQVALRTDAAGVVLTGVEVTGLPLDVTATALKVVHVWCEQGSIYNDPLLPVDFTNHYSY